MEIGNLYIQQVPDLGIGNLYLQQVPDLGNREPVYTTGSREWLGEIPNRLFYLIVLVIPFVTVPFLQ